MEAVCSSKTLVSAYKSAWRCNPEDQRQQCFQNNSIPIRFSTKLLYAVLIQPCVLHASHLLEPVFLILFAEQYKLWRPNLLSLPLRSYTQFTHTFSFDRTVFIPIQKRWNYIFFIFIYLVIVKAVPLPPWRRQGWEEYSSYSLINLSTRWGWVVSVTSRLHFTPGERTPGTHCTGGWVGPRAGLDTDATLNK
jgi:hypothetical protein